VSKKKPTERPDPAALGLPPGGVDSHAHLDLEHFAGDFAAVLARAAAAGVSRVGQVFLGPEAYRAGAGLFADRPEAFFILGIHPHDATTATVATLAEMEAACRADSRIRAVGEAGLDYFYDLSPRDVQRRALAAQAELARSLGLPLVIHCRDAAPDTLRILLDQGLSRRWPVLWHCFGGDADLAREIVGHGWHVSIPGPVSFAKSDALRAAVAEIPLERLLLETDCPYLAPEPWRGKRNEPAFLAFTARAAAQARGMDPAELWLATGRNAETFFGI
jgi:TatD DNase family protein